MDPAGWKIIIHHHPHMAMVELRASNKIIWVITGILYPAEGINHLAASGSGHRNSSIEREKH